VELGFAVADTRIPYLAFQDNIYPPLKATVVFMRVFEKVTRNLGKQVFKTTNGNEP